MERRRKSMKIDCRLFFESHRISSPTRNRLYSSRTSIRTPLFPFSLLSSNSRPNLNSSRHRTNHNLQICQRFRPIDSRKFSSSVTISNTLAVALRIFIGHSGGSVARSDTTFYLLISLLGQHKSSIFAHLAFAQKRRRSKKTFLGQ